jgi:hypothetical protein
MTDQLTDRQQTDLKIAGLSTLGILAIYIGCTSHSIFSIVPVSIGTLFVMVAYVWYQDEKKERKRKEARS